MQEPLFPSTLTHKLYNERAILLATFVGGPLAGGYLLARNFSALDEPAKAGKTWMVTIGILLLLFASFFMPVFGKVPAYVYSLVFCLTAHAAARKFQGNRIFLHQEEGGKLYSSWRSVFIGLISLTLMLALIFGMVYLLDQAVNP